MKKLKKYLVGAAALMLAIFVPLSGIAQGRHDERPHGVTKSVHERGEQGRRVATGGRHDEGVTTHRKKAPATKMQLRKFDELPTVK